MNFFGAGQVAMVNQEVAGQKDSGFELAATVGGEFFLTGLESLGFNFETGIKQIYVSFNDALGREVKKVEVEENSSVDVSGLLNGVYLLNIKAEGKTSQKKLIISR
jgi:hypothetical protein